MLETIKPLHMQFAFNTKGVLNIFPHISGKEMLLQTPEEINPPLWQLLHMTQSRSFFARQLGTKFKPSWGNLNIEAADLYNAAAYPELDEIAANWKQLGEEFLARLEDLTAEELAKPVSRPFPIDDGTKLGILTFCAAHESYHLGQLYGWLRSMTGKSVMQVLYEV